MNTTESPSLDIHREGFVAGNPKVEVLEGIAHLYKQRCTGETKVTDTVCILAIPGHLPPSNLCQWIGKDLSGVVGVRLVRSSTAFDRHMAFIKFTKRTCAEAFVTARSGKPFHDFASERCVALYVEKVEFVAPSNGRLFPPSEEFNEIPTCPVCLERLDRTETGILTLLCQHEMHCSCLAGYAGNVDFCPVCRFRQTTPEEENQCMDCNNTECLWICLICGNIGCGRYNNGHARDHFAETQHTYAMDLDTEAVWDYAADRYVHRLVQNKADGKLVELSTPQSHVPFKDDPKLDHIVSEYNMLLTAQLESQREYYEKKLAALELGHAGTKAEAAEGKESKVEQQKRLQNQVNKLQAKSAQAVQENRVLKRQVTALKQLNDLLMQTRDDWLKKVEEAKESARTAEAKRQQEVEDLKGQVRDLMIHIESAEEIGRSPQKGAAEGSVRVGPAPSPPRSTSKRKKKKG